MTQARPRSDYAFLNLPNSLARLNFGRNAMESLERLRELYEDLIAFSETRLANVDRLWLELESSVQDFRKLLDKRAKSNTSRQSLTSGIRLLFFHSI